METGKARISQRLHLSRKLGTIRYSLSLCEPSMPNNTPQRRDEASRRCGNIKFKPMKKLSLILAMLGIITGSYSQSTMLWSRDFTTEREQYYWKDPDIQIANDTIKVVGRKNDANGQRLLIVNYNLNGDTISTKTFGGDSVLNNSIIDYIFDSLNHVYILQKEQLEFYKAKIVLQKYSVNGSLIWTEQIVSPADTSYSPHSIGLANDTGIFITAYKEYDYPKPGDCVINTITLPQLYAYNSKGDKLWLRYLHPVDEINHFAYNLFTHNNTAFLFGGIDKLVKVDINNNMLFNGNTGIINGINDVQLSPDNNLLITASMRYRISKVDLNGAMIWTHEYGTFLPQNVYGDNMQAIIQDKAGNIYITGRHYGMNYGTPDYTNADILTLKYDSSGNLIWENRYAYGGNNADIGNTIALKNGQVYVGGESQRLGKGTDYDYLALKIDSATGDLTGVYRYNGPANGDDFVSSLHVFDNGKVALTGVSYMNGQYNWTTQLLSDIVLSTQPIRPDNNFQIYPNPIASGQTLTIKGKELIAYSIISPTGQIVQQGYLNKGNHHSIKLENIRTGLYFLNLKTEMEMMTSKIIVK